MKVQDAMSKKVTSVKTSTPVKEVSKLIFKQKINGVPVVNNKKVVGFITERDILQMFYPTFQEFFEDPVHTRDFEGMEKRVSEVFAMRAEKIMSKNVTTVTADTPLLKAQSLMLSHKVGRLPVVDEKGNLIGILAKGDVFNALIGRNFAPHSRLHPKNFADKK